MSTPPRKVRVIEPRAVLSGRFQGEFQAASEGELSLRLPISMLDRAAAEVLGSGGRFVTVFQTRLPEPALVAVFALHGELVSLWAPLEGHASYASLTRATPASDWAERELHDLHDITPLAHTRLDPIARPDADALVRTFGDPETFVIPYGPIRSGVFEAIQFVITTGGEDVLGLEVKPMFKRRDLEARLARRAVGDGAYVAERVAGISSVAHALAYCQAVERGLGIEPPNRAQLWRAVFAELERIANHLDSAYRLAEDAALAVGQARFMILKEDLLRLQAQLTGSRFARGSLVPGGIRSEPRLEPEDLAAALSDFEQAFMRDRKLLMRTTSFTDRLIGSGALARAKVEELGGVGPVARASGVSVDARFERPYGAYRRLGYEIVTREDGDAMARLEVRFGEIDQSLHVLRQALDRIQRDGTELTVPCPDGAGAAFGWSEAAQGEVVYWVAVDSGIVSEARIASPSFRNWPLFMASFQGDVLTDFAFIEHSFGLTPAGADR